MKVECNIERSTERLAELDNYFSSTVLHQNQFFCPSYDDCSQSQNGTFIQGQLHHLGRFYDLSCEGKPLRVVIVGQEYGHQPPIVSLKNRYQQIMSVSSENRFYRVNSYKGRNPHMRGTTTALRLIHGHDAGADYDDEFIEVVGHGRIHLFDTFALVNYLLCSAIVPNTKKGISSTLMKDNCALHFRKALEILSPTVIVVQGKGFWKWVQRTLDNLQTLDQGLFTASFPEGNAVVVPLTHPSAQGPYNWGVNHKTKYLIKNVIPALQQTRKHLALQNVVTKNQ